MYFVLEISQTMILSLLFENPLKYARHMYENKALNLY